MSTLAIVLIWIGGTVGVLLVGFIILVLLGVSDWMNRGSH